MRVILCALFIFWANVSSAQEAPKGFVSLFNGKDFNGWKLPEGDNGHWKIVDVLICIQPKAVRNAFCLEHFRKCFQRQPFIIPALNGPSFMA